MNELDLKELFDHIGPLLTEADEDELAKRFDLVCYNMQAELLRKGTVSDYLIDNVKEIGGKLSKKGSIPAVSAKMELIKLVQTNRYWQELSVMKLEQLRIDLRDLVRFIDKDTGRIIYTDFEDTYQPNITEHDLVFGASNLEAYKKRVSHYIRSHQHYITIHKLRMNVPVTNGELQTLEKMMFEQGEAGTREQFEKAYGSQPLGRFIRSIVGLEVQAAKAALSKFVNAPALNAQQIRFVDTIVQYLTVNGVIDPEALFAPPFTDIATNGLTDVFVKDQAGELVRLIENVNENALAVS